MPELPEVEIIKLGLSSKLGGEAIKKVDILSLKSFLGEPNLLIGKKVLKIWRRAKILGINLSENLTILIHLKMSGQLILVPRAHSQRFVGGHPTEDMLGGLPNKSTRVVFEFDNDAKLYFNDQRRFGWIKLINSKQITADEFLTQLGPEPLGKSFHPKTLKENLLRHKGLPIKVALLDQTVVAGLGNIYASEACFNAKLDPQRKVDTLSDNELKRLYRGIRKALKDGISHGGSTRAHFVDSQGQKGYFLDYAFVYGLDKKACKVCKSIIKKLQLRGRGTYYCPNCQK